MLFKLLLFIIYNSFKLVKFPMDSGILPLKLLYFKSLFIYQLIIL